MAFELVSADINTLIDRRLLHDVTIDRYLYRHSEARVVIDWDESRLEGDKKAGGFNPTAQLGAAMLNTAVTLKWRGADLKSDVECFKGYVAGVSAEHRATRSYIVLHCVSDSQRADLIPRFRVWQSCTLGDICKHIAGKEPLFQVLPDAQGVLSGITIDLSVQYEETDFAYLGRMLHAWGIPMSVDDRAGKVLIGTPRARGAGAFPAINWHCDSILLEGALVPVDAAAHTAGTGPTGEAKGHVNKFNQGLVRAGSDYQPRLDDGHEEERRWIAERVHDAAFQANSAVYRLRWEGAVFDHSPGTGVSLGDQPLLVRASHIRGGPDSDTVSQEFVLQDFLAPLPLHRRRVNWPSRMLWATVTKNDGTDPFKEGRLQVEFDLEKLDSANKQRCWLPTVTPYGGQKGKTGTSGFLSLPEVGERVLVQFLGDWDSDAVVIGAVRGYQRAGFDYDPHETKRWQTPSGNQMTMTTREDGTDIVRVKVKDKVILEGKISGGKEMVIFDLCDSDGERIHFEKGGGPTRLDIFCSGEIYMSAGQKLLLEGGQVQIKSKTGPVNIDGAPMVMINCGPWALQPLKREPDKAKEGSGEAVKKRAKPPKWTGMVSAAGGAVAAAASAGQTQEETKTWIEIELKDDQGNPIPNERYVIKLPDGRTKEGRLDANGRAREDDIIPGTGQVSFPDIDANEWRAA